MHNVNHPDVLPPNCSVSYLAWGDVWLWRSMGIFLLSTVQLDTFHLLHTLQETCHFYNMATQIESASQLKCHIYFIRTVIQGYPLVPLHNNLSTLVPPTP